MNPQNEPPHHSLHPQSIHLRSLVNKEGNINVRGTRDHWNYLTDLYHFFFSLSWPKFFIFIAVFYFSVNLLFGIVYFFAGVEVGSPSSGWEHFSRCFFLSVQNLSAVDFSRVISAGLWVHLLMSLQAFLGLLTLAAITGLFYARFSRPTARIIFSNKIIIGKHNGRPCLHFRIANERLNQIAEAHMSLYMTKNETSLEGELTRKFYDLKLEREHTPLFALSWTVRHYMDEDSPLYRMDEEKMRQAQMGIVASLTGTDETFAQPIIARHAYAMDDIVYNRRFKDIIVWHERKVHINLRGIHDFYEPELAHAQGQGK